MLELDGLVKRFGSVVALDGVGFRVARGEIFGFVGTNGAGKSTAMRIALGVLAADAGEVRWDGRPVDAAVRRRVGYMPEERGLYPKMRARDQLAYLAELHGVGARPAGAAAERWLDRLGLADRRRDPVETLSLGNQQRVQLAAALVHDPQLLVLDEPFSGLDPVGVDVLADVLRERVADGVACVFSSHRLELVQDLCTGVGIIRAGRMVASGSVDDLRRRRGGHRLRVHVTGAAPGWARSLPGVRVAEETTRDGGVTVLADLHASSLSAPDLNAPDLDTPGLDAPGLPDPDGAAEQRLLDAARAAGRVTHFSRVEPTLADLFRAVVSDDGHGGPDGANPAGPTRGAPRRRRWRR